MKKFVTLIAALALCFALCISASAYTASEILNTSNASTGTAEVAFGSRTVTAEVYPAGTTFAAGKDVPGRYFSEFQVYGPNNNYVGYYFSSPAFTLPDDGNAYELQVFDGYSFTYEYIYVTSAVAAEPAGEVESVEIADSDTVSGTWAAKITGVFSKREDGYNAYDVVVEPDSIIECYDYYSGNPRAYSTIYAYSWNGSEYVAAPGVFSAETGTAAEVFAACGNPDMLYFVDFYSYKELYVTLAGAAEPETPAEPTTPAEPATPAEPVSVLTVDGENITVLLYGGEVSVACQGTATENAALPFSVWGDSYTSTGILIDLKEGSTISIKDIASGAEVECGRAYKWDAAGYYTYSVEALATAGLRSGAVDSQFGTVKHEEGFDYPVDMFWASSGTEGTPVFFVMETKEAAPVESFTDVTKEDTFYDAIAYVTEKGIMSGVSETAFERSNPVSHKEIFGSLELAGADAAAAKAWAAEQKLEDTAAATREDVITMLWIANGKKAADESVLAKFADAAAISAESKTAMAWAVEQGIIKGYADGTVGAQKQVTRGATAAILYRAFGY